MIRDSTATPAVVGDTIAWTTPTFSAGNFAMPVGTWTVESADVVTYAYLIVGKTMTVSFSIDSTTVGGTGDNTLQIAIPASKVATKQMQGVIGTFIDNGTRTTGFCVVAASGTVIGINRTDIANLTASTNNTTVRGQITFEIN